MPDPKSSPSRHTSQRAPPPSSKRPPTQTNPSNAAYIDSSTNSQPRRTTLHDLSKPKSLFQSRAAQFKFRPALLAVGSFAIIVSGVWLGAAWKGQQQPQKGEEEKKKPEQRPEAAVQPSRDETLAMLTQRRAGFVRVKQDLEEKLARLEQRKRP